MNLAGFGSVSDALWAAFLLLLPTYLLASALKDGWGVLKQNLGLHRLFLSRTTLLHIQRTLSTFPYYTHLNRSGKRKFINRLIAFMRHKEFRGADGLTVTDEMKILISAAAIQLTFGLHNYKLYTLDVITIYPDYFFHRGTRLHMKGAVSVQGNMHLSWRDFVEGYQKPHDRYNLGLHEMTHALRLNTILGNDIDKRFASLLDSFDRIARPVYLRLKEGEKMILRSYGGSNVDEFFSVCVEHFFEAPLEFQTNLPYLYNHLAYLLNQYPHKKQDNYRLSKTDRASLLRSLPDEYPIRISYKHYAWHWSLTLLLIGLVSGISSLIFFSKHLVVKESVLVGLFVLAGLPALLQRSKFYQQEILRGFAFYFYCFFGLGACVFTILLWLNFLIPLQQQRNQYVITTCKAQKGNILNRLNGNQPSFELSLQDPYSDFPPRMRTFPYCPQTTHLEYVTERGVLGLRVLKQTRFVNVSAPPKNVTSIVPNAHGF